MKKKVVIWLMGLFYMIAGVNHFINPDFYLPLIPDYLPSKNFINLSSGFFEVILGLGVLFFLTRKIASIGIIILLFLFIPAHIHFIQIGSCIKDGLCVPEIVAWARLIIIHPLLIYWAYFISKN